MVVLGSGRTNDLPNLTTDYVWKGDANGVPQAVASSSLRVDNATSASYAVSSSRSELAGNATSASFATTASYAANAEDWDGQFSGSAGFTGSVTIQDPSANAFTVTSGPGDISPVIIEGGPDFTNKVTPSSIRGIENYIGVMLTGSDFQVGNVDGSGVGVRNKTEGITTNEQINLFHGSGNYSSFQSSKNNNYIKFRGDTVKFQASGS